MNRTELTAADLAALAAFDTPTICNALEQVAPQLQGRGFTTRLFVCGFPSGKPLVGYARTGCIRAAQPHRAAMGAQRRIRDDYYRYVDAGPRPSIVVIEDLDGPAAGTGAWWGEVQSAIHVGLGALGLVTNGAVRDLDQWAPGFPYLAGNVSASHAYAMPVSFGNPVSVFGLEVHDGDLLHVDRHGAVVVPPHLARALPDAARAVAAKEARILAVARGEGCTAEKLIRVFGDLESIH